MAYKKEGGCLWGPLGVDVQSNLINGLSIILEYTLADSNFFILAERKDGKKLDKKFDISIDKFVVHACTHEMAPSVYSSIEEKMKTQPMNLPFRRYHVTTFSISSGLLEYISDSLLVSPVLVPNRLVFCLLPSRVYDCDQSTNPYVFGFGEQSLTVTDATETASGTTNPIQSDAPAATATTTTTTTPTADDTSTTAARNEVLEALKSAVAKQKNIKETLKKAKKTINKVRKISCTLNGVDIDGLQSSSLDEIFYFRMNKFLGFHSGTSCNSVSLEEFKNGSTMYVFDFSTSLNSGQQYLVPSLKSGHLRCAIQFKSATEEPMHLLVLSEYNSNLTIGSTSGGGRTISSNYFI